MPILVNAFNTGSNSVPSQLFQKSFAGGILRLAPNGQAPIWALAAAGGTTKAKGTTHGYFSKTIPFLKITLNANALAGDATVSTASGALQLLAGDMLYNATTREIVRVSANPTVDTTVAVTRGSGRIAAAGMTSGQVLYKIGTAFEENSGRPTARSVSVEHVTNYTQIFRNSWAVSDTARATMMEQGYDNVAESRQDASIFHSVDMEMATIFGQKQMTTLNSTPLHTTQGIVDAMYEYAPTNVTTGVGAMSYDDFVAAVTPAFTYSSDPATSTTRTMFVDNNLMAYIQKMAKAEGSLQLMPDTTTFGMRFTKFRFHLGEINLVIHPLFNGMGISGAGLVVDNRSLNLAYLDGRNAKVDMYDASGKPTSTGTDGTGGSLTSEFAVELVNPYSCAYIGGVTSFG
jgi:hypothetical protein